MKLLLLTIFLIIASSTGQVRYDNYKVYRVTPRTTHQLEALKELEISNGAYSFWSDVTLVDKPVDILAAPQGQSDFEAGMAAHNFEHEIFINNVQELVDAEEAVEKTPEFGWTQYHKLDEIYQWLHDLEKEFPGVVRVVKGGSTYENREILGVHVSFKPENGNSAVFIEGGIHAREWISPATVTYILNEILRSNESSVHHMAHSHDWYIFPVFNPDGYAYTFTHNRLWRKTRSRYGICRGADANRNWDYMWMQGGANSQPCLEKYAGPKPFSEIETESMSKYIDSIAINLIGYITVHSYGQMLLYPYGHTTDHLDNYKELHEVGVMAAANLAQNHGTIYQVGNIAETIYKTSGVSMDWVKAKHHTRITYSYELRDTGRYAFFLPSNQIIPTADETFDSLITIISEFDKRS